MEEYFDAADRLINGSSILDKQLELIKKKTIESGDYSIEGFFNYLRGLIGSETVDAFVYSPVFENVCISKKDIRKDLEYLQETGISFLDHIDETPIKKGAIKRICDDILSTVSIEKEKNEDIKVKEECDEEDAIFIVFNILYKLEKFHSQWYNCFTIIKNMMLSQRKDVRSGKHYFESSITFEMWLKMIEDILQEVAYIRDLISETVYDVRFGRTHM